MTRLFAAELLKLRTLRSTWGFGLVALAFAGLVTAGHIGGTTGTERLDPEFQFRLVLDAAFPASVLALAPGDHSRDERVPSRDHRADAARDAAPRALRGGQAAHGRHDRRGAHGGNARRGHRRPRRSGWKLSTCPSNRPKPRMGSVARSSSPRWRALWVLRSEARSTRKSVPSSEPCSGSSCSSRSAGWFWVSSTWTVSRSTCRPLRWEAQWIRRTTPRPGLAPYRSRSAGRFVASVLALLRTRKRDIT